MSHTDVQIALLLQKRQKVNHILHLILAVITGGFWLLVWIIVCISVSLENSRIERQVNKLARRDDT